MSRKEVETGTGPLADSGINSASTKKKNDEGKEEREKGEKSVRLLSVRVS